MKKSTTLLAAVTALSLGLFAGQGEALAGGAAVACTFHSVQFNKTKQLEKLPSLMQIALYENGTVESAKEGVVSTNAKFNTTDNGNIVAQYTFWHSQQQKYVAVSMAWTDTGNALLSFDNNQDVFLVGICS